MIFDIDYLFFIRDYEYCNFFDMKVFVMVYCDGILYDVGILEEVFLIFKVVCFLFLIIKIK